MTDPARELWLRLQKVQHGLQYLVGLPNRLTDDKSPFAWKKSLQDFLTQTEDFLESFRDTAGSFRKTLKVVGKIPAGPATPAVKILTKLLTTSIRTLETSTATLEKLREKASKAFIPIRTAIDDIEKIAGRVSSACEPLQSRVETLSSLLRDLEGIEDERVRKVLPQARRLVGLLEKPVRQQQLLEQEWKAAVPKLGKLGKRLDDLEREFRSLEWIRSKLGTVRSAAKTVADKIQWALSFLPWWASLVLETVLEWINGVIEWVMEVTGLQALLEWLTNLESLIRPFQRELEGLGSDLDTLSPHLKRFLTPLETIEQRTKHLVIPIDRLIQDLKRLRDVEGVPINRAQYTPQEAERIVSWLRSQGVQVHADAEKSAFGVANERPVLYLSPDRSIQAWQEEYFHYLQWIALKKIYAERGERLTERQFKDIAKDPRRRFHYEQQVKLWLLKHRKRFGFTIHDHSRLVEDLARYLHRLLPEEWEKRNPGKNRRRRRRK